MKYILLFLCVIGSMGLQAQNDRAYVNRLTDEFTQKLTERNINDYVVTQHVCSGRIEMFKIDDGKMCVTKDTYVESYILWKEEDQTFLKKIDNCGLFHSIPLQDAAAYEFFMANGKTMMGEEVLKYKSASGGNEPAARRTVQPCSRVLQWAMAEGVSKKEFNLFDIGNTSEEGKNLNYEANQQLKLIQFQSLMDKEIEKHNYKRQEYKQK
ncbi:hypothetical protein POV27_07240 [Aureisphaera galaxeae]|uniref:hypothetical protein n=1 Tax=Aureisphaera galaxeae TaxID=1538023 RepID=UPI002350F658|nr:hypothetical protein [Aureisphaera galaxeae]MDC8003840.1 hypothetical protein [Aureisphaera galaxeae]